MVHSLIPSSFLFNCPLSTNSFLISFHKRSASTTTLSSYLTLLSYRVLIQHVTITYLFIFYLSGTAFKLQETNSFTSFVHKWIPSTQGSSVSSTRHALNNICSTKLESLPKPMSIIPILLSIGELWFLFPISAYIYDALNSHFCLPFSSVSTWYALFTLHLHPASKFILCRTSCSGKPSPEDCLPWAPWLVSFHLGLDKGHEEREAEVFLLGVPTVLYLDIPWRQVPSGDSSFRGQVSLGSGNALSPLAPLQLEVGVPVCRCWSPVCSLRRRQWRPTPVLLPGESNGQRSLVGCNPWGH